MNSEIVDRITVDVGRIDAAQLIHQVHNLVAEQVEYRTEPHWSRARRCRDNRRDMPVRCRRQGEDVPFAALFVTSFRVAEINAVDGASDHQASGSPDRSSSELATMSERAWRSHICRSRSRSARRNASLADSPVVLVTVSMMRWSSAVGRNPIIVGTSSNVQHTLNAEKYLLPPDDAPSPYGEPIGPSTAIDAPIELEGAMARQQQDPDHDDESGVDRRSRRPRAPFAVAIAATLAIVVGQIAVDHASAPAAFPGYAALPSPAALTSAFDVLPRVGGVRVSGVLIPVPVFSGAAEELVGPGGVLVAFSGPGAFVVGRGVVLSRVGSTGVYAIVTGRRHGRLVVWRSGAGFAAVVLWGDRTQLGIAVPKLAGLLSAVQAGS